MDNCINLELADISLLKNEAYINGDWVSSLDTIDVCDPSDGTCITQVAKMTAFQTSDAINAANATLKPWQQIPAKERSNL